MLFNVPQYVDIEDKIAGPLTAKQLLWMFGMGVVLIILWGIFEKPAFYFAAVPVAAIFVALAFYRPYNQPLIKFVGNGIMFLVQPKFYTWKRTIVKRRLAKPKQPTQGTPRGGKLVSSDDIEKLARLADSGGRDHSRELMELIQKNKEKVKKKGIF